MQTVPKVAAIHDLSCYGRCSLTVIMPVLSMMGVQVCPLPTAVLSSHLGGFRQMEFYDFTDHLGPFAAHWRREALKFDGIYSGFLASERQIAVVAQFIDDFSANRPLVLIDPVMGDEGRLYSTYTPAMQDAMKQLILKADVITPNYTEACFLLGEPYLAPVADCTALKQWAHRLTEFGPKTAVITGIPAGPGTIVNIGYDRASGQVCEDACQFTPVHYPGTGDIYASVLLGALLGHSSLESAMKQASAFVAAAVQATSAAGTPIREGVLLERVLPLLRAGSSRS